MKPGTRAVLTYLQQHPNDDITALELSEILNINRRSVDGSFTRGIVAKDWGYREEGEIQLADGSHKTVKFFRLTDEGKAVNLDEIE